MDYPKGLLLPDIEKAVSVITDFIKEYFESAGAEKAVIGLSGGVDSALAAWLTCRAIDSKSVLGIMIPVDASADVENIADAQNMADGLRVGYEIFELKNVIQAFEPLGLEGICLGNLTARMRMATLYGRANQIGGLVIGTGNKSEIMTGYFTKHGDGAVDLLPLGDMYKTNVYQLAAHAGIPSKIIGKAPSAGLLPGQTDEGELGIMYQELDSILFLLYEKKMKKDQIVKSGYSADSVDRVQRLVSASQHKRDPTPKPSTWKKQ
ncbi:MAG: NAD+ synthase [Candidatus Thorarchaeota archaeon]|nr:MAG: NAD+ synthase [Candidatus Thorarchaeota archaeon]